MWLPSKGIRKRKTKLFLASTQFVQWLATVAQVVLSLVNKKCETAAVYFICTNISTSSTVE